jgi:hypothetical protein
MLDADGTLTCVTCHRAHAQRFSERRYTSVSPLKRLFGGNDGRHKTYYLRRANPDGELCRACHF